MQALSKAAAGKSYTIKWMFGIPEVLDKIRNTVTHQDETDPDFFMQRNKLELLKLKGEMRNEI